MKTNHFFYILVILILFSCNNEVSQNTVLKEETFIDISYGDHSKQTFDLYLPANRSKKKTKTLILVHGGAWIEGDKSSMNYIVNIIKENLPNYAIVNINYRLATIDNHAFPMQIDDINTIIATLKNRNFNISDNIGFIGVSAGGHLSLLYSYIYNTNNNIKMVCSIVGPTNFTDLNYVNNPEWLSFFLSITGVDYDVTSKPFYEQISPLFRATSKSPPTFMAYGNVDPLVPSTQANDLNKKLKKLGVYNEFNLYEGGHADWDKVDQLDAYTKLVNFVKKKF
jgi:acetyl esterase/lipase